MADTTVKQFAEVVRIPLEQLLEQLKEAGLPEKRSDDIISDEEKLNLLKYLRQLHGKDPKQDSQEPKQITLKRKTVSELKLSGAQGKKNGQR